MRAVFFLASLLSWNGISSAQSKNGADITVSPVLLNLIEESKVPALEEGPIIDIQVREGQTVEVGALMVQIDDQRARFRKDQAEFEYQIAVQKEQYRYDIILAEAESKVAKANLQRAMESRKRFPDTPSQAEVDEIELKVSQSEQHLEKAKNDQKLAELSKSFAEKNLAAANYELDRFKIKAPIKGAVVEIFAKRGDWVRPGDPIARIIRVDRLRVEGYMTHDKARPSIKDCAVTVVLEGAGREASQHSGKVVFVSPEIDPNDRKQRILAEVDNSKGFLGPGMRASMIIHLH